MSLLDIIKQASKDSIESTQPAAFVFGVVTKTAPLTVSVEGRLTISEPLLIVPETLRTYRIHNVTGVMQGSVEFAGTISMTGVTGTVETTEPKIYTVTDATFSGTASSVKLSGKITITSGELFLTRIFNVGDELLLARVQGGQRYVVLERLKEKR